MNDVLTCECGSVALAITAQSYHDGHAVEGYECEHCGQTGTLTHDPDLGTTLTGCLE